MRSKRLYLFFLFFLFIPFKELKSQNISAKVFGQNAWMPDSVGAKSYNGKLDSQWQKVKDSQARIIRYGGIAMDREFPTSYQYLKIIDSIINNGMEPIMLVPFYNNKYNASQAAEVVEFINITSRKNVKYWIIGNEPDNEYGYVNSAQVAEYVKSFSAAMKKKDRSIKIIAPETSWYNRNILDGLVTPGGAYDITGMDSSGNFIVDLISFHAYPFSGTQTRSEVISYLSEPRHFGDDLTQLNQKISDCNIYHHRSNSPLRIAVTEANIGWKNPLENDIFGLGSNSFTGGQFWVEMIGICMKKNVDFINFWSVIEGSELGYLYHISTSPKPTYHHFRMLADNFTGAYCNGMVNNANIKSFGSKINDLISVIILNEDQSNDFVYTLRLDSNIISGSNPLKINIDAGTGFEYNDTASRESSILLSFTSSGELIKKCVYKLYGHANDSIPPECSETPVPHVFITSPANNTSFFNQDTIFLQAKTSGGTGTINKVEFFADITKLGEDTTSPYSLFWHIADTGSYELRARATFTGGDTAVSAIVKITVVPEILVPPPATQELIAAYSQWKYLDNGSNQGTAWTAISFDDSSWKAGNAELGYGDGNEATVVSYGTSSSNKYITTYFRKAFSINDISTINRLELSVVRDDGIVVYLNGAEVYRNNMPSSTILYSTRASTTIDGTNESAWQTADISYTNLITGNNVIAAEIHQNSSSSSDISFNLKLQAFFSDSTIPSKPLSTTVTSPANNSSFNAGSTIPIQATASGGTGAIQKVEFFADTTKLGEDATSPYSYTWVNVPAGNYALTAKTTDSLDNFAVSGIINIAVTSTVECNATGAITREVWNNISGTSISSIPLNTAPGSTGVLSIFEAPKNAGNNYGQRIRGYVCPPATGNYIFWIASDNNSELWLSPNDKTADKIKIASVSGYTSSRQWTKYASQKSGPVSLEAGKQYYIEALHKEGTGSDNLAVGWQLPNGNLERPIPGSRLMPAIAATPPQLIELIPANSLWKYLDDGSNQGSSWTTAAFYDSLWKSGNAELGYGDGGEATVVSFGSSSSNKYITTYFRKNFSVADISGISGLELNVIRDDGIAVYLNGVEIYRNNMPASAIYYNTLAPSVVDGANESTWVSAFISSANLVSGNNIIAIEIHQNSPSSSDISFNLKLNGIYASSNKAFAGFPTPVFTNEHDSIYFSKGDFIVYPNPSTGLFTLEYCLDSISEKEILVEIYNSVGEILFRKSLPVINACVKEVLELDKNILPGMYIMNVIADKMMESKRIILTK